MNLSLIIFSIALIALVSCDPEPTGPETDCRLLPPYKLEYNGIDAAKVFDIRPNPPIEIKNGTIEYNLFYQWSFLLDDVPVSGFKANQRKT